MLFQASFAFMAMHNTLVVRGDSSMNNNYTQAKLIKPSNYIERCVWKRKERREKKGF